MSEWRTIPEEDIDLSEDGETIEVRTHSNEHGNVYVELPVGAVRKLLWTGDINDERRAEEWSTIDPANLPTGA